MCAAKNNIRIPSSWAGSGIAGTDGVSNFLRKQKDLPLRQPELTD
jgi:hypothetical protein